jgi:uncharacterized paraquat-inducible protein A
VDVPGEKRWSCPRCDHVVELPAEANAAVPACPVCGNGELYKKKDFPHGLGMTILVLACLASTITYARAERWATWAILIGSALFDGLLYLWVKDVIVCYRCHAHVRGVAPTPAHRPFELTIGERYRQERMRMKSRQ